LGGSEVEGVLHRLDGLTLDEARMAGTDTLRVIHGLVSNLRVAIGGTQLSLCQFWKAHRATRIDGMTSMDDIWQALGMLHI
jgi:hypothetical protein